MDQEWIKAKIINRQILTDNVLELTIETYSEVKIIPWQWILFLFNDEQWSFQRAYSVVDQDTDNEKTMLVFAIKLSATSRSSATITWLHIGNEVTIKWPFGNFVLQNTLLPKVFIWTGVGIAPLLNMAKYCTTKKQLFFSVSYKRDLFYEDKIKRIHDLSYEIHLSQENLPEYFWWRIDISTYTFDPETEFYICWKPEIVHNIVEKLTSLWQKRLYYEKF